MLYKMNQDDISGGIRGSCYHCPIARMIHRYGRRVRVDTQIFDLDTGWSIDTPDEAKRFINRFDSFYEVQPITLELPD